MKKKILIIMLMTLVGVILYQTFYVDTDINLYVKNQEDLLIKIKEKYPKYEKNFKYNIDRKNKEKLYLELTQPQNTKGYEQDFDNIVKDFVVLYTHNKRRLDQISAISMVMGYGIYFEEPNFSIILGTNIIKKLPKDFIKNKDFIKDLKTICKKTDPAGPLSDYCFVGK